MLLVSQEESSRIWLHQEHHYSPLSSSTTCYLTSHLELHLVCHQPKQRATDGCAQKQLYGNYSVTADDCFVCVSAHLSASGFYWSRMCSLGREREILALQAVLLGAHRYMDAQNSKEMPFPTHSCCSPGEWVRCCKNLAYVGSPPTGLGNTY